MTPKYLTALPDAIRDALIRWSEQPDGDLRGFLTAEVGQALTDTITSVVGRIEDRSGEVSAARLSGQSAAHWLGNVFEDTGTISLLGSIPGLLEPGEDSPIAAARQLLNGGALGLGSLASTLVPEALLDGIESAGPALDIAGRFFTSPLGDAVEAQVTSVASAVAARLAADEPLGLSPQGLVASIDLGLRIAKVGYKMATGEVDGLEGAELIEDRLAAGLAALAGEAAERGLELAGGTLGSAVGTLIGAPGIGAVVGRTLGAMAGSTIRRQVERGTARVTRAVVRGVKAVVKSAAQRVGAWARKLVAGSAG